MRYFILHKLVLPAFFMLMINSICGAVEKQAVFLLEKATDLIYNFDPHDENILPLLDSSQHIFERIEDKHKRLYGLSQTEFLYGMASRRKDNNSLALGHFQRAKNLVTEAIQSGLINQGYALLSEINVQILWCKGTAYQLKNLDKAREIPLKVLQNDPENTKARQALAIFYMKAPQFLGGNIDKSIDLLLASKCSNKAENFANNYILGLAYRKKGDLESAIKHFNRALDLYSNNKWALEDLSEAIKISPVTSSYITDQNIAN